MTSEPTRFRNRAVPASAHWKDDPPHDVDEFCDDCIVPFTEMQEARAAAEREWQATVLIEQARRAEADAARATAERDVAALAPLVLEGMLVLQRLRGRLSKVTTEDVARLLTLAALQEKRDPGE